MNGLISLTCLAAIQVKGSCTSDGASSGAPNEVERDFERYVLFKMVHIGFELTWWLCAVSWFAVTDRLTKMTESTGAVGVWPLRMFASPGFVGTMMDDALVAYHASLAGSGTVSSSGLCSGKGFSLEKEKAFVNQAKLVLIPSQAALGTIAEWDVREGDFKISDCEWEKGPAIVGCPFVGTGEQATGRVDVPDDGFVSAGASAAASTELEISFFVRSLPGRNITMKFGKSRTVQELCNEIASRTGVRP